MLSWIIICFILLVMTYGLNRTLTGVSEVTQTTQNIINQGQKLTENTQLLGNRNLPDTVIPRNSTGPSGVDETQVGGDINGTIIVGSVGDQLSDTRTGSGVPALGNQAFPLGTPIRSFVEFGEVASAHPKDIWLDNVALTIPPSNVGTTDIIFVDAGRPQQCYQKCKTSPFCRFFSYWKETGVCNLHQTLQNGETSPENMIRYAYTVPFSQHWLSGYVRKSGDLVPPYQL